MAMALPPRPSFHEVLSASIFPQKAFPWQRETLPVLKTSTLINAVGREHPRLLCPRSPLAQPPSRVPRPGHGAILWCLRAGAGRLAVAPGSAGGGRLLGTLPLLLWREEKALWRNNRFRTPWSLSGMCLCESCSCRDGYHLYIGITPSPSSSSARWEVLSQRKPPSNTGLPYTRCWTGKIVWCWISICPV